MNPLVQKDSQNRRSLSVWQREQAAPGREQVHDQHDNAHAAARHHHCVKIYSNGLARARKRRRSILPMGDVAI